MDFLNYRHHSSDGTSLHARAILSEMMIRSFIPTPSMKGSMKNCMHYGDAGGIAYIDRLAIRLRALFKLHCHPNWTLGSSLAYSVRCTVLY
jgi:hypothetical protein